MESTANPFKTTPTPIPEQPTGDYYKMTPIDRLQPLDVFTSLLDAGISFMLVSIGGEIVVFAVGWPLIVAPTIGFSVALFRYFGGMAAAHKLLSIVEEWSEEKEPPAQLPPERYSIRVEVKENNNWKFADLPGEQAALINLAQAIISKKPLSKPFAERTARSCGLTQDQFRELRDLFIDRGWAEWKHPTRKQQGILLNFGGKAILREIVNSPPLRG